jgi:hypothetical protein
MRTQFVALACFAALVAGASQVWAADNTPSLRPLDPCAAAVIANGRARSSTVRALEARLAGSDVVAYVHCQWHRADQPEAFLTWVSHTPGLRYVRISLAYTSPPWARVEMLGHEMQHAVEVAEAGWVRSEADLARLFTQIGRRTRTSHPCFETEAALAAGLAVRRDLAVTSRPAVVASAVVTPSGFLLQR